MYLQTNNIELPITIEDAVDILLSDLPLLDRTRLSAMSSDELDLVNHLVGRQIARDFRLWSGNDILLSACLTACAQSGEPADPVMVIIRAMWQRLQETHVLRIVK